MNEAPRLMHFMGVLYRYPPLFKRVQTVGNPLNEPLMQSHTFYGRHNTLLEFTPFKKILFASFFMRKVGEHFFRVAFAELASPHS